MKRIMTIKFCGKPLIYTNLLLLGYSYKWDACILKIFGSDSYNS